MKVFIVLLFSVAALAQISTNAGGMSGSLGSVTNGAWTFASPGGIVTASAMGMPGRAITGAPYSAEEVTEHVQTLADGTHITQPGQKVMVYRDSQGRTRTERTIPLPPGAAAPAADAPSIVEIFDPVAGTRFTLNPRNRTARKMVILSAPPPPPGAASTSANGVVRISPAMIRAPSGSGAAANPDGQPRRPQVSRESLGTQNIEGVLAEGTRTTFVYPIGAVGNDRPITSVSERWMSPELKVVVLSKSSDPRNGDTTTTVTNISRAEPDPSLFQVPPDYQVIDPQTAVTRQ